MDRDARPGRTTNPWLRATLRSARFYFWPIIAANVLAMTVGAGGDLRAMAWFALVIASIASFGFLANDLLDRTVDRANRAGHLEDSDRTGVAVAWTAAGGFCLLGLSIAWALGPLPLAIAAGSAVCLALYSPVLRRAALVPNLATAAFAAGPLWTPLVLARSGGAPWQWWFVSAIFVMLTAREILMDVRDREGDAAGRRRTLATWLGAPGAARIGVALTLGAFAPFAVAVLVRVGALSPLLLAAVVAMAGVVAGLMIGPVLRIDGGDSTAARTIQSYVHLSRLAMAVLPVLGWLLAGPA